MNTLKYIMAVAFLSLAAAFMQGCKDDPPCDDPANPECPNYDPCDDLTNPACPNYDPCWDKRDVSAAFEAGMYFAVIDPEFHDSTRYTVGDTILTNSRVRFEALDPRAETFEWQVGSDVRTWTSRVFQLLFDCTEVPGGSLPVRLITTRAGDPQCTGGGVLRDTAYRTLVFLPLKDMRFMGTFRGQLDRFVTHPYEVTIRRRCRYEESLPCLDCNNNMETIGVVNMLDDGCERLANDRRNTYRELRAVRVNIPPDATWLPVQVCPNLFPSEFVNDALIDFHARMDATGDSIEIRFTYVAIPIQGPLRREPLVFRGVRVQ